ncbi:MFS general substrate transporter [Aspergillus aculeatinus CBS 121060]|uniref:MFS general substrate transporter n=1 Tax=Aspergillus aculeatinus CBS 121060 TaxID=1448322 RepID=A0ACD1H670_9EURO|nr:MFS general substrate transporter [Aspergillus aculeatinus CBS 121060]RAH69242.1 MFS general substrate transporter [Aspergillus aculeatinus CBS 121060]
MEEGQPPPQNPQKHPISFWLVFLSLCLLSFVSALDGAIISTALPKVTAALGGETDYIWIANSFTIAQTVVQPFVAQLCDIFGRRGPILVSVCLFLLGSGLAGGAPTVGQLIAGRTVQGLGSGGIYILVDLVVCDLVPQRERGKYLGIVLSLAAVGAVLGPVLGGALAQANWRWVFYLNLPLAGPVLLFMLFFLRLDGPAAAGHQSAYTGLRESLRRIDWVGNLLFAGSILAQLLGLVGGGTLHPWSSASTLVPLILGFVGWGAFHVYEYFLPSHRHPCMPPHLFAHRNSFVGFVLAFDAALIMQWTLYFLPIYFQGVQRKSPLTSGVDLLPYSAFLIPFAMVAGGIMSRTGIYRPLHATGFGALALALGLFTLLGPPSPRAAWVLVQVPAALGQGFLATTILPAIQAALSPQDTASSTGVYAFLRSLAFVWGSTAPAIVFNARIDHYADRLLPGDSAADRALRSHFTGGQAYGAAADVAGEWGQTHLSSDQRRHVQEMYRLALKTVWQVGLAFALCGLVAGLAMRSLELHQELEDTGYGLKTEEDRKGKDAEEKAAVVTRATGPSEIGTVWGTGRQKKTTPEVT